jgi:hypothetical protein
MAPCPPKLIIELAASGDQQNIKISNYPSGIENVAGFGPDLLKAAAEASVNRQGKGNAAANPLEYNPHTMAKRPRAILERGRFRTWGCGAKFAPRGGQLKCVNAMYFSDIRGIEHQQYELRVPNSAKQLLSSRLDNCRVSKVAAGVRTDHAYAKMPFSAP